MSRWPRWVCRQIERDWTSEAKPCGELLSEKIIAPAARSRSLNLRSRGAASPSFEGDDRIASRTLLFRGVASNQARSRFACFLNPRRERPRAGLWLRSGPSRFDRGRDAAPGAKLAVHHSPDRIARFHDVFQHLIDDIFLEDAEIAVTEQIFLQRLQFEAALAWHVADVQPAEI